MDCFDNNFGNNFENNAWNLEHIAKQQQEILNRIMQGIMIIITSALLATHLVRSYVTKLTNYLAIDNKITKYTIIKINADYFLH